MLLAFVPLHLHLLLRFNWTYMFQLLILFYLRVSINEQIWKKLKVWLSPSNLFNLNNNNKKRVNKLDSLALLENLLVFICSIHDNKRVKTCMFKVLSTKNLSPQLLICASVIYFGVLRSRVISNIWYQN